MGQEPGTEARAHRLILVTDKTREERTSKEERVTLAHGWEVPVDGQLVPFALGLQ